jgi:hypothetical protein
LLQNFLVFLLLLNACPGRAAVGPRLGFGLQEQAEQKLFKHAPTPPRSYGQLLELAEGIFLRGFTFNCSIYRGAACLGELQWARG